MAEIPAFELKKQIESQVDESEQLLSVILRSAMRTFPLDSANQLLQKSTWPRIIRR
jgi:hypothetical protein